MTTFSLWFNTVLKCKCIKWKSCITVAIKGYICFLWVTAVGMYKLIRMAHSRWAQVARLPRGTMGVRATIVTHLTVTCGVWQSGWCFDTEQTWLCVCVLGKCYRPAIDQIVKYIEK